MNQAEPLFDRSLQKLHRVRARIIQRPDRLFLHRLVATDLIERLAGINRHFETSVCVDGTGAITAPLLSKLPNLGTVRRANSLCVCVDDGAPDLVIDEDQLPIAPKSIDLLVSNLTLQDVNDLPGALVQIRRCLRPDGLMMAAVLGGESLQELRLALAEAEDRLHGGTSPRVAPFGDIRDFGALLQRTGFALPVVDRQSYTLRYDTLLELMLDLRGAGLTNSMVKRSRRPLTRGFFTLAAEIYATRFSEPDGRLRATLEVLTLSGWAPDASQQQPLARGSAKMPLDAALKSVKR